MKVLLINRGVISQTHPIGGKSGKHYGTAIRVDHQAGVVGEMTLADYEAAKFDLINSHVPGQDWVPSFVEEPPPPIDPLTKLSYRELQQTLKEHGQPADGGKDQLVKKLRAWMNKQEGITP